MRVLFRALLRALGFGRLLVLVNAGLVALAVLLVMQMAIARLERLAREQALARVELAGVSALQAVTRSADDVLTSARLLAERPTLRRLLVADDRAAVAAFLEQFRTTSELSAVAVLRGDSTWVQAGAWVDYAALVRGQGAHLGRFSTEADSAVIVGATSAVIDAPGAVVVAVRALDSATMQSATKDIGLPVELVPGRAALRANSPRRAGRQRALEWDEAVAEFVVEEDAFVATLPIRAPGGEVVGLVEAALPRREVANSVRRFRDSMWLLSLGVAAFGALASALLARRLVVPVERLRAASERIGRGDFSTPIPRPPEREVGELAATMEDMRTRLLGLTGELRHRRAEADAILGGIAEGVFAVDAERRIRYLNPQAAALLGIETKAALGRFCGDVLRPREERGGRPCEERCPIVHARFRGSSVATEHLVAAIGSVHRGLDRAVFTSVGANVKHRSRRGGEAK